MSKLPDQLTGLTLPDVKLQTNRILRRIDELIEAIDVRTIDYFGAYIYNFFTLQIAGVLSVTSGTTITDSPCLPLIVPIEGFEIVRAVGFLRTAPSASKVVVDVRRSQGGETPASIYQDQNRRLLWNVGDKLSRNGVVSGSPTNAVTNVDVETFAENDLIAIYVDDTDGTAADLTIELICKQPLEDD